MALAGGSPSPWTGSGEQGRDTADPIPRQTHAHVALRTMRKVPAMNIGAAGVLQCGWRRRWQGCGPGSGDADQRRYAAVKNRNGLRANTINLEIVMRHQPAL